MKLLVAMVAGSMVSAAFASPKYCFPLGLGFALLVLLYHMIGD